MSRTASLRTLRLALVAYRPLDNNPVRLVALGARRSLETALGRWMLVHCIHRLVPLSTGRSASQGAAYKQSRAIRRAARICGCSARIARS